MPFGTIFTALFFVLAAIAATGAMLSILEVPVSIISERWHISRRRTTILVLILIAILGAPAALSQSTMANVTLFNLNFFDFYDFISSNLFLPLSGMGVAVFVGWVWKYEQWDQAISNQGHLSNKTVSRFVFLLAKYIAPLAVLAILFNGLGIF
jgi:NSS family neurotransmitter:Na+ symporter